MIGSWALILLQVTFLIWLRKTVLLVTHNRGLWPLSNFMKKRTNNRLSVCVMQACTTTCWRADCLWRRCPLHTLTTLRRKGVAKSGSPCHMLTVISLVFYFHTAASWPDSASLQLEPRRWCCTSQICSGRLTLSFASCWHLWTCRSLIVSIEPVGGDGVQ